MGLFRYIGLLPMNLVSIDVQLGVFLCNGEVSSSPLFVM